MAMPICIIKKLPKHIQFTSHIQMLLAKHQYILKQCTFQSCSQIKNIPFFLSAHAQVHVHLTIVLHCQINQSSVDIYTHIQIKYFDSICFFSSEEHQHSIVFSQNSTTKWSILILGLHCCFGICGMRQKKQRQV